MAREIERWQRELWLAVFGEEGLTARRSRREGVRWLPLDALLNEAQQRGLPPATRALHVFGVSYMARGYHRMLAALGRTSHVRIYTLNPCREFWEDLETVGELRRRLKKDGRKLQFPPRLEARQLTLGEDPLGLAVEGENLALRLWGRPGRENVRLLNQLTDGDFEGRFAGAASPTLLGRLQDDVLDRVARTTPDPALCADGSLVVLRCPGLRRELEVVAAEIWRLVRADPTLRFNDIAVVVPEASKEAYLSHVGAVFGEAHELPHNVADLPLGGAHRLGEAAQLLLALPTGSFSRRELLPLLIHPSILARFPEASAADWVRLTDELGIVHGADHQDHAGTYIARDLFNWDQGLRRLALGALMTGPRGGDETTVPVGEQSYLPADLPGGQASAMSFALLVRSLIADARFAQGADGSPRLRPLPQWLELMRGLLSSYLVPADDDEESLLGRCLRALQELEEVEIPGAVSYQVAADLARRALSRIGAGRGQYLARRSYGGLVRPHARHPLPGGVRAGIGARPVPVRAAPRAARSARGEARCRRRLAAGAGPLPLPRDPALCPRAPGAVLRGPRRADRRRAAPLVGAAGAARDPGRGLPGPRRAEEAVREPAAAPAPLRRHRAPGGGPPGPARADGPAAGRIAARRLPPGAAMPDLGTLGRAIAPDTQARLFQRLSVHAPPPRPQKERERVVIPLAAIRQFLEDPLQGSARFRLRMREVEGEELLLDREEEPFESGPLARTSLLREAMVETLLSQPAMPSLADVVDVYRRLALREELAGRLPTGLFREAEQATHQAILQGWLQALATFAGDARFRVTRFGHAGAGAPGGAAGWLGRDGAGDGHPAIQLEIPRAGAEGGPLPVELVGRTDLVLTPEEGLPGSVTLSCRSAAQGDEDRLRGFLDHVALAAAGLSRGGHGALTVWSRGGRHELGKAVFRPARPRAGPRLSHRGGGGDDEGGPGRRWPAHRRARLPLAHRGGDERRLQGPRRGRRDRADARSVLRVSLADLQLGVRPGPRGGRAARPARARGDRAHGGRALRPVLRAARRGPPVTVRVQRPPQLDRLGTRHAVVEASAGTGKTYLLEHLVVDLLLRHGVELEQILVVTFTEKATAELVQRVRAKLTQLRDLGPDHPLATAAAAAPDDACWILDEGTRQKLRRALLAFDRASITTIHGFCQRLLTEQAFLNHRLFDEELVDEEAAFHGAFVNVIREVAADARGGALPAGLAGPGLAGQAGGDSPGGSPPGRPRRSESARPRWTRRASRPPCWPVLPSARTIRSWGRP